jgi:type IV pilus biogenesis protein CpaD/CtpE
MRRALLLLILLPGCEAIDPYTRDGAWRPLGANQANLRTHVANPAHLDRGSSDAGADGQAASEAVRRYRTDRVRPLPASGVAEIQPTGVGGATTGGVGAGGGGANGGR